MYGNFSWLKRMGVHQAFHTSRANRILHLFTILYLLFSLVMMLSLFSIDVFGMNWNLSLIIIALIAPIFLVAELLIGFTMIALLVNLYVLISILAFSVPFKLIGGAVGCFIAFYLQTKVGHGIFEPHGRDDTKKNINEFKRTKNPLPLILIFFYHLAELFFELGYRPRLYRKVKNCRNQQMFDFNSKLC